MKDQLKLLVELQRHDARIQELEQMNKVWPQKLEAMRSDLQKVEQLLQRERLQLDETEAWRQRQDDERRAEEDQLVKAKQRASQVKNVKEAMASERELQATRKLAQEREEEVVKLGGAVETAKKSIAQHEGDLDSLRKHVVDEEAAAQAKTVEIDAQIIEARKGREEMAARVSPSVLKKYSSI